MTEKRFTFDIDNENEYDEEPYFCDGTDSFYVNNKDEMELFIKQVNELYEEYQNLKFSIINSNVLNPYKKEIKRLKEQIKELVYINYKIREENEELKKVLGSILISVKRDYFNHTGEIKVFVNPNSFDLISEVLKNYGALKDWYK